MMRSRLLDSLILVQALMHSLVVVQALMYSLVTVQVLRFCLLLVQALRLKSTSEMKILSVRPKQSLYHMQSSSLMVSGSFIHYYISFFRPNTQPKNVLSTNRFYVSTIISHSFLSCSFGNWAKRLLFYSHGFVIAQCTMKISIETRSEEHTSELQSRETISYAVFCLKKKNKTHKYRISK